MWSEAIEMLDRADRLHRQFFRPARARPRPTWEPPVDLFESERALTVVVALPGVEPGNVQIVAEDGALLVTGERPIPAEAHHAILHRLEIPHGHFERRIPLPPGRYEVERRELANGCLLLTMRKLG